MDRDFDKKQESSDSVNSGPYSADLVVPDGEAKPLNIKEDKPEGANNKPSQGGNSDWLDKQEHQTVTKTRDNEIIVPISTEIKLEKNTNSSHEILSERNHTTNEQINETMDNSKEDKPEEDVPEDFFDDFLKEDFMAGLDIVDEDEEEQDKGESHNKSQRKKSNGKKESKSRDSRKYKEKIDHVRKFRESPPGQGKKLSKRQMKRRTHDNELKKLNAELEEIRNAKPKKADPIQSGVDADNFDIRRDPEKTRQAIQRDKIKSAKDKEKRLITDIVETGLVPPGMELEVDIEEVRRIENNSEKKLPEGDLRERLRPRRSKSPEKLRGSVKKRTPPRKRSHSPSKKKKSRTPPKRDLLTTAADSDKKRSTSRRSAENSYRNRELSHRSPKKSSSRRSRPLSPLRSPLVHRSPLSRRSPLPRHSPLLHFSPLLRRSPLLHRSPLSKRRSPPPRRRSRSRSLIRRLRSRSPILPRRSSRDRSPTFRRRRDRSYSPSQRDRRRRSRSPLRKEEKMSFLEELAAKLNEARPSQLNLQPSAPVTYVLPTPAQPIIAPVPAPVPPPQSTFFSTSTVSQSQPIPPATQQYDRYDQNFFIGNSAPLHERELSFLNQQQAPVIQQAPHPNGFPRNEPNLNSNRDVAKLFGDKRIKLSDFLAITAKPQVINSSPANLQEKIKVIQRCQEAIKILNERRFAGPLVVYKTDAYHCSKDMKMSPLLRKPIFQLPFTTPGLKRSNEIDFTKCCETLLYRIGIEKTLVQPIDSGKAKVGPLKDIPPRKEIAPPVLPAIHSYSETPTIKVTTKTLGIQTEKELSSCKECLRRKGILYANCGIQAGSPAITFSVSTQVNEADFYSMIPKTQSLASLTPAQLLGKQSMITDHSRARNAITQDNMSRMNFQVPSPPPPPILHYLPPMPPQTHLRETAPPTPPLYSQTFIPSLMAMRPSFGDNKDTTTFPENRRGGYSNKRF